jgi:hypothetical protein
VRLITINELADLIDVTSAVSPAKPRTPVTIPEGISK